MINGINLSLTSPEIVFKSNKLLMNPEIGSLMNAIDDYFKQKHIIYHATLVMSNNEYETIKTEFGNYRKRINIQFRLMTLTKVTLYDSCIEFTVNGDSVKVHISKDFFYFLEWENSYYE